MKDELKNINLLIDEFNKIAFIAQRKAFITIASEIQKEEIETKVEDTTKAIAEKVSNAGITGKKKKQIKEENGKDNKGAE
mgnify:CR=1 FL=1